MRRISAALSAIIGTIVSIVTLPFRVLQRLLTPAAAAPAPAGRGATRKPAAPVRPRTARGGRTRKCFAPSRPFPHPMSDEWVCSSIGRAPALQAGGCRFESGPIHVAQA